MTSKSGSRPFRAELQMMRRRAGSEADVAMVPVATSSTVDLGEVRDEIAKALETFRGQMLEDMRAVLADAPRPAASAPPGTPPTPEVNISGEDIDAIKTDIQDLAKSIQSTKVELGQLMHSSENNPRMDVVRSELRAVVAGQETATGSILECMEAIEEATQQVRARVVDNGGDDQVSAMTNAILDNVVRVFEHCNFQDLSGQRITKVINTLNFIDERIQRISSIWGEDEIRQYASETEVTGPDDLERTLAKPSEESDKITQDEIDKMFS